MKNKQPKTKHIHFLDMGIFPGTILFAHGFSYDDLISLLNKKKINEWIAPIVGEKELIDSAHNLAMKREMFNPKTGESKTFYYILIKEFKFTDFCYCKLAHEILHITQFHLPDILNRNKEIEAEAYLHTYIMERCLNVLRGKAK